VSRPLVLLLLGISLAGCATCTRHPVACTVVAGVAVLAIGASEYHTCSPHRPPCRPGAP